MVFFFAKDDLKIKEKYFTSNNLPLNDHVQILKHD